MTLRLTSAETQAIYEAAARGAANYEDVQKLLVCYVSTQCEHYSAAYLLALLEHLNKSSDLLLDRISAQLDAQSVAIYLTGDEHETAYGTRSVTCYDGQPSPECLAELVGEGWLRQPQTLYTTAAITRQLVAVSDAGFGPLQYSLLRAIYAHRTFDPGLPGLSFEVAIPYRTWIKAIASEQLRRNCDHEPGPVTF